MAAWSQARVRCPSLVGITGLNPAGGMDVSFDCCVLSYRGFWDGPITRAEESYRLWYV